MTHCLLGQGTDAFARYRIACEAISSACALQMDQDTDMRVHVHGACSVSGTWCWKSGLIWGLE